MNYDAFPDEDTANYHPDADHEIESQYSDYDDFYGESTDYSDYNDDMDDSMDGDAESAFGSCGWGVDEQYNSDYDNGDDW